MYLASVVVTAVSETLETASNFFSAALLPSDIINQLIYETGDNRLPMMAREY
jgi:hypothetical protein